MVILMEREKRSDADLTNFVIFVAKEAWCGGGGVWIVKLQNVKGGERERWVS